MCVCVSMHARMGRSRTSESRSNDLYYGSGCTPTPSTTPHWQTDCATGAARGDSFKSLKQVRIYFPSPPCSAACFFPSPPIYLLTHLPLLLSPVEPGAGKGCPEVLLFCSTGLHVEPGLPRDSSGWGSLPQCVLVRGIAGTKQGGGTHPLLLCPWLSLVPCRARQEPAGMALEPLGLLERAQQ